MCYSHVIINQGILTWISTLLDRYSAFSNPQHVFSSKCVVVFLFPGQTSKDVHKDQHMHDDCSKLSGLLSRITIKSTNEFISSSKNLRMN